MGYITKSCFSNINRTGFPRPDLRSGLLRGLREARHCFRPQLDPARGTVVRLSSPRHHDHCPGTAVPALSALHSGCGVLIRGDARVGGGAHRVHRRRLHRLRPLQIHRPQLPREETHV